MVYTQLVLARRKAGITHEAFRARYEQHMAMVQRLIGRDAMPLRHTRRYVAPPHPAGAGADGGGEAAAAYAPLDYDVVVDMVFNNEADWARFVAALAAPDVARAVADDEAAFWDRRAMSVAVVDELRETVQVESSH